MSEAMPLAPVSPWERVLARCSAVTGIAAPLIVGPGRKRDASRARFAVVIALRETGLSYPRIGRRLGGRDHSTMIHADRAGRALMARDAAFRVLVEDLCHAARGEVDAVRWVAPVDAPKLRVRPIAAFDVDEREEVAQAREMADGSARLVAAIDGLRGGADYNPVPRSGAV